MGSVVREMMLLADLLLVAISLHSVDGQGCGNCAFPFTFNGWIHSTCTTVDGDPTPWCSTLTDSNGNHVGGNWEYCSSDCPGVNNPPINVALDNQPGKCFCGVPNQATPNRIVGGSETDIAEYPWQVSLLSSIDVLNHFCGGSLISNKHVVTAAHCTEGKIASDIFVSIGDSWKFVSDEADSAILPVMTIKQHPDYSGQDIQNDISILELSQTIDLFSKPNIKPLCLPSAGKVYSGEDAVVSGWGTIHQGSPSPANLHGVDVQIYGNCGDMTQHMTEDMICAGDINNGGVDSCQGDSGGPLFLPDSSNGGAETLAGVVSWGFGCGDAGNLGIYAEVSHFRDWIDSQISGDIVCPTPGEDPMTQPPTTTALDTTTEQEPECWKENTIPYFKVIKVINKVRSVEDCDDLCDKNELCEFYKWKKHRKVNKSKCYLLKVDFQKKNNWSSGSKYC